MRIKIISEGLPINTKVVNADTNEVIEGVRSIEWSCKVGSYAIAKLEFVNISVEVIGTEFREFKKTE